MFLVSDAFAADAASTGASMIANFLPMILIIVVFWLFLIRPQQKRAKAHDKMVNELQVGDEVITAGGIIGKITALEDQNIRLQIADVEGKAVAIRLSRQVVTSVLPKGTAGF